MEGTSEAGVVEGHLGGTRVGVDGVEVVWGARIPRFLGRFGLGGSVSGRVDAVVVDRRGCETTPRVPGELDVEGRRVVVVPDRSDGAPPVEAGVRGHRDRYGRLVRTLRSVVAFDAMIDDAFECARRRSRVPREDGDHRCTPLSTDGGPSHSAHEGETDERDAAGRAARLLADVDTPLAVGGFAAAVEPLR